MGKCPRCNATVYSEFKHCPSCRAPFVWRAEGGVWVDDDGASASSTGSGRQPFANTVDQKGESNGAVAAVVWSLLAIFLFVAQLPKLLAAIYGCRGGCDEPSAQLLTSSGVVTLFSVLALHFARSQSGCALAVTCVVLCIPIFASGIVLLSGILRAFS